MMKTIIDLLLVAVVWVFVLDLSGFWDEVTTKVSGWLTNGRVRRPFSLKPFSCSLCMTFWTGLVYLLATGHMTLPMVAYVCMLAYLTPRIKDGLLVLDALLAKLFDLINTKV